MSLKAFHVIFITASSALAFGFGVWAFKNYFSTEGVAMDFVYGAGSCLAGVALIVYELYFLKKFKRISYL